MRPATLDQLCINTIRTLAMDAVQRANSGHPGMPMGMADVAYVLWTRFLKHNPKDPAWPNRDRFILSAGHGSMLLYSLLFLTGYDLTLEDLMAFRQWGSRTPGHPEYGHTPGVETTTGPLGQGFGNAVGMAIAERFLAATFNRPGYPIFDHYTYAILSDGDLMEGISHEAASLAGHLGLGKLICLYDDNNISIEGSTDLTFTEDVAARFRAYNWHVQEVDGYDLEGIAAAIRAAQVEKERPSLILCRTHIAYGSPNKQDKASAHGEPLGEEEVRLTKQALGWPPDAHFWVPPEVLPIFRRAVEEGEAAETRWREIFARYAQEYPQEAALLERLWRGELPEGWEAALPTFSPADGPMATRQASGIVLNALAKVLPTLIGGSADLAPSTQTLLKGLADFQRETPTGRNLRFGVREHAMGAILNGMALHGGVIPYGGTFLVFSDYMRPPIRLAAMMGLPVVYVFTHDSLWVGEDGPTHQPVEHLPSLRAIPNLSVLRPCDANETAQAWRAALKRRNGPTALLLTRQKVPILDRRGIAGAENLARGAYVLRDPPEGQPEILLIASGSEVHVALGAQELLAQRGVRARVVSMPSWDLFEAQPEEYRAFVLPPDIPARLAVEAAVPLGWERYVGPYGDVVGIHRFGASAPYEVLMEKFGFTPQAVAQRALEVLARVQAGSGRS
ncbi:MAG: transketolase [Anaerolineae bacterium]|nr:transketolase [Anaerolineae bacterium]MDW7992679.1 transketolase [Anaerolineae bacterium]